MAMASLGNDFDATDSILRHGDEIANDAKHEDDSMRCAYFSATTPLLKVSPTRRWAYFAADAFDR